MRYGLCWSVVGPKCDDDDDDGGGLCIAGGGGEHFNYTVLEQPASEQSSPRVLCVGLRTMERM